MDKMPLNGFDLMREFNLKEGKKVGKMLEKIRDIWLSKPDISKEELLNILRKK